MNKASEHPRVGIGSMSGTSTDGVDAALVDFSSEDQLATLTAFFALCILMEIQDHFSVGAPPAELIVGGGGIHNKTLMSHLKKARSRPPVSSGARGIAPDAVDAAAITLLAWGTLCRMATIVPAITGAAREPIPGDITPGKIYLPVL